MAGQKARIDKDSNGYLSANSRPEGEASTAYHDNKSLEAKVDAGDEPGPRPVNFHGGTDKDKTRKADRHAGGTTGIGDAANGLEKMEDANPFASVLEKRFGIAESENPGVAGAPASSDNPSLGMYSVNNTDFRQSKPDVKGVLESIALQAAEAFEMLDDNSNVPDPIVSDLQNTAKVVAKLYEYVSKNQSSDGSGETTDGPAVAKDGAEGKPGDMKEEAEDLEEKLVGDQHKIDKNHNGKLDAHDFKLLRSKKTVKEAIDTVFAEILRGKLNGDS